MDLGPVPDRKIHVRQHVGLAVVDERAELEPLGPELVGDVPECLAGAGAIGLDERLAQGGRHHGLLAPPGDCLRQ